MKIAILGSQKLDAGMVSRILPLSYALQRLGATCNVIPQIDYSLLANKKMSDILSITLSHSPSSYVKLLSDPPDIVIFEGTATPQMSLLQKMMHRSGVKVVYDLCDALFLPSGSFFGMNVRPGSFCLEAMVKNSDLVIVNGRYLFSFASFFNKNTVIIPDPIDTAIYTPNISKSKRLTLGWEGVGRYHIKNLEILLQPLSRLGQEYDIKLQLISSLGDIQIKRMFRMLENILDIDYGPEHWVGSIEFPKLLSGFDIMLSPLQDTPWYNGKSALRVGIGMAMGIPIVASPVGEQKFVIKNGINGFLARTEKDWYSCLRMLSEDDSLRRKLGKAGRQMAEKNLSLDYCSKCLYQTLEKVIET